VIWWQGKSILKSVRKNQTMKLLRILLLGIDIDIEIDYWKILHLSVALVVICDLVGG
jgi:hypothetical protein